MTKKNPPSQPSDPQRNPGMLPHRVSKTVVKEFETILTIILLNGVRKST